MPAVSQAQRGYLAAHFGKAWMRRHHFDNPGPLPAHKKKPDDAKTEAHKKAVFVAQFLLKCAAAGVTDPAAVAVRADAFAAALEKAAADPAGVLSGAAGALAGVPVAAGLAGLALPALGGYLAGGGIGAARNQLDATDAEVLRRQALAHAYRRRAAEAKVNAQVRQLAAADPSKYVVVG